MTAHSAQSRKKYSSVTEGHPTVPCIQREEVRLAPRGGRTRWRIRPMRQYYVYIMASRSRVLYAGVTNDLVRRVAEHKAGEMGGFTSRYRVTNLVYYEGTQDVWAALAREKQIKAWRRDKKIALIEATNPEWEDLSAVQPVESS